jgi:murein DD-endopeptidase MepM/ murein hydrolase activator NlpD
MSLIADLKFAVGVYRHAHPHHKLMMHGIAAMITFPIILIFSMASLGLFTVQDTPVAASERKPVVRQSPGSTANFEVAPPYVPATAWPARGAVTADFGVRTPAQRQHSGIDFAGNYGDPAYAFRTGTVVTAEKSTVNKTGLGKYVVIDHGNGLQSYYGHLSTITVSVGQAVTTQTVVGKQGSTGQAYGVHLHFEIRQNGKLVDPMTYLTGVPARTE